MDFNFIIFRKEKGIATIVLNRPESMNALRSDMLEEIGQALDDAERDRSIRVVVVKGSGNAFCVGADLKHIKENITESWQVEEMFRHGNKRVYNRIAQFSKPVIAAVNGTAMGGGYELMLACDIAVAAEDAVIADQHINFGIIGPCGATQRTTYLVGPRKAKEIILLGKKLTGKEAEEIGLVNLAVPRDQLESTLDGIAKEISEKSPVAVRITKALINRAHQIDLSTTEELETMSVVVNAHSEDYAEGLRAFSEKRKPVFKGR